MRTKLEGEGGADALQEVCHSFTGISGAQGFEGEDASVAYSIDDRFQLREVDIGVADLFLDLPGDRVGD